MDWRRKERIVEGKAQDAVEDALMTSRKVPPLLQISSSALWLRQPDPSCFGKASGNIHKLFARQPFPQYLVVEKIH